MCTYIYIEREREILCLGPLPRGGCLSGVEGTPEDPRTTVAVVITITIMIMIIIIIIIVIVIVIVIIVVIITIMVVI